MMMLRIGLVSYLKKIMIATSVLMNVILGGKLNQTFSARNWEWKRNGKPNISWLIDKILGKDHCSRCWSYWKTRRQW
jgi:hypothetical protein